MSNVAQFSLNIDEFSNPEAELFKLLKKKKSDKRSLWNYSHFRLRLGKTLCFKSKKNKSELDF